MLMHGARAALCASFLQRQQAQHGTPPPGWHKLPSKSRHLSLPCSRTFHSSIAPTSSDCPSPHMQKFPSFLFLSETAPPPVKQKGSLSLPLTGSTVTAPLPSCGKSLLSSVSFPGTCSYYVPASTSPVATCAPSDMPLVALIHPNLSMLCAPVCVLAAAATSHESYQVWVPHLLLLPGVSSKP